jgi:hypothetical protein
VDQAAVQHVQIQHTRQGLAELLAMEMQAALLIHQVVMAQAVLVAVEMAP